MKKEEKGPAGPVLYVWWFSGWYAWGDYENKKERTEMERDDDP